VLDNQWLTTIYKFRVIERTLKSARNSSQNWCKQSGLCQMRVILTWSVVLSNSQFGSIQNWHFWLHRCFEFDFQIISHWVFDRTSTHVKSTTKLDWTTSMIQIWKPLNDWHIWIQKIFNYSMKW
jgi:hypothetical protein